MEKEMILQRIGLLKALRQKEMPSFGDEFEMELTQADPEAGVFVLQAKTGSWMRNLNGVVHGGVCAALADHAMGTVAFCVKKGDAIAPTVQLQMNYHRPTPVDMPICLRVRLISAGKTLLHLSADALVQEKLCFSATATYFCKTEQPGQTDG